MNYEDLYDKIANQGTAPEASPYGSVFASVVRNSPAAEAKQRITPQFEGSTLKVGPLDTGISIPASAAKQLAQLGSGLANYGVMFSPPGVVDEKRLADAELLTDPAGKALNFMGSALPTLAAPFGWLKVGGRAAPAIEGAIVGGGIGFTQPVGTGESRAFNTAVSAGAGAAIPAALSYLSTPSAQMERAAQTAQREGIPVGIADVTQNKTVRSMRSILNDVVGGSNQEAKQAAYNAAFGRRLGIADATSLPASTIRSANRATGREMGAIWERNDVAFTNDLFRKLQDLKARALNLPEGDRTRALKWINEFEGAAQINANGQTVIPGSLAHARQSALANDVDSATGFLKKDLADLRKTIIDAFNQSVTGQDAAALTAARGRYKLGKTLLPLAEKADVGTAGRFGGDLPAALVPEALRGSYTGGVPADLADLASAGSQLLVDRVPQTGGSLRALIQNGLLGGTAMLGAGAAAGIPGAAATLPYAAATGGGLRVLNEVLNRPGLLYMAQHPGGLPTLIPASLAASLGVSPSALP